jgi:hypothetical protein
VDLHQLITNKMINSEFNAELAALTSQQTERYNYLFPHFKEDALHIVKILAGGKGKNSWGAFQEKFNVINSSDYLQREYQESLYSVFELDTPYLMENIIQNISVVRSDMNMPSYGDRIKVRCEADFLGLFVANNVYDSDGTATSFRRKVVGYTPIFKIKPEQ